MKFPFLLLLLPGAVCAQISPAPTGAPTTPAPLPPGTAMPMWRCQLPGGTYEVALRSIVSVSSHEYLIDGGIHVTEVNVDTPGTSEVRFYYIEPTTPASPAGALGSATLEKAQQLLGQAAAASGQDVTHAVVKTYPATTHAHTVEFRVASKDQLQALFQSVETAFRLGKNTVFQPAE